MATVVGQMQTKFRRKVNKCVPITKIKKFLTWVLPIQHSVFDFDKFDRNPAFASRAGS